MRTSLIFFMMLFSSFAMAQAKGNLLTLKFNGPAGPGQGEAKIAASEVDGRRLLFVKFPSPVPDLKAAAYVEDGMPEGVKFEELPQVLVQQNILYLSRKKASLKLMAADGSVTDWSYELAPAKSVLQMAPNCRKFRFRAKTTSTDTATFPAMIDCQSKGKDIEEVTFSTLEEAEWFGSGAFENAGKGERWKSFVYKDIATLGIWQVSWGDPAAKAVGKVLVPKTTKKVPKVPKRSLTFLVGVQYLKGTAEKGSGKADVGGLQVPLTVQYQKDNAWWFFGAGYELFVMAMPKGSSGSNSISELGGWGGGEYKMGSFAARAHIGYLSRSFTVPDLGVTVSSDAPRFGADFTYVFGKSTLGAGVMKSTTSGEGKFDEMQMYAYFQNPMIFNKETRLQLTNTTMNVTSGTTKVDGSWLGFGLLMEF